MGSFAYVARDAEGRSVEARVEAHDERAAIDRLRSSGLIVLELRAESPHERASDNAPRSRRSLFPPARSVVEGALRQLALLTDSGLTLLDALRAVARYTKPSMRAVLLDVAARIENGSNLADALARWPRVFSPLVVELVRAGELSGALERAFLRSADHIEARRNVRAAVAQALLYPSIVVAMTTLVAGFLVTTVIPELEKFLSSTGKQLPGITRALLATSHALADWALPVALVLGAAVIVVVALDQFGPAARVLDRVAFALPIVGTVRRLGNTALFARSLSVLLGNGVVISQALRVVAGIVRRPIARSAVLRAEQRVIHGGRLADALARAPSFTPALEHLVAIGEVSGSLDRVLADCAQFHEAALASWIKRASFLIEPVITLIVGGIVGFVYVAFFVAMFSLS